MEGEVDPGDGHDGTVLADEPTGFEHRVAGRRRLRHGGGLGRRRSAQVGTASASACPHAEQNRLPSSLTNEQTGQASPPRRS